MSDSVGRLSTTLLVIGGGAIAAYIYVHAPPRVDPADSELARAIRSRRAAAAAPPRIIYVPLESRATPEPTMQIDPDVAARWAALGTPVTTPSPRAIAEPTPTAITAEDRRPFTSEETALDQQRTIGAAQFERAIAALATKADAADEAWQRYLAGCRQNISTASVAVGVADRNWIAFAGASVVSSQWTDACADAGSFFALERQVRAGMCAAEDAAVRSWVIPGVRNEIRSRYRLGWDGWSAACR